MIMLGAEVGSFEGSHTIARKVYLRLLFARNAKKPNNTEKLDRKKDRWDDFSRNNFWVTHVHRAALSTSTKIAC